jgi:hypothetical protein
MASMFFETAMMRDATYEYDVPCVNVMVPCEGKFSLGCQPRWIKREVHGDRLAELERLRVAKFA